MQEIGQQDFAVGFSYAPLNEAHLPISSRCHVKTEQASTQFFIFAQGTQFPAVQVYALHSKITFGFSDPKSNAYFFF